MAERFANERKNIKFESKRIRSFEVLFFRVVTLAKNAMKKKHSNEGPLNTTVGKSGTG